MTYEELLKEADSIGLIVKEKPLQSGDGRIFKNRIVVRRNIPTQKEKSCVLAEELGHHYTTAGNILDQSSISNRRQENIARTWAYNKMIGLTGIIRSYEHGCRSKHEISEYLGVTEEFLDNAIERYRQKYGEFVPVGNYVIRFEPVLLVNKVG